MAQVLITIAWTKAEAGRVAHVHASTCAAKNGSEYEASYAWGYGHRNLTANTWRDVVRETTNSMAREADLHRLASQMVWHSCVPAAVRPC